MKYYIPPVLYTKVKALDNILIQQRFGERQAHFYVADENVKWFNLFKGN